MKKIKNIFNSKFVLKIRIIKILFIPLVSLLISCDTGDSPGEDNRLEPVDGSYFLEYGGTIAPSVFTQYTTYYFTDEDYMRPIYVYGKNAEYPNDITEFIVEDIDGQAVSSPAYVGDNDYFEDKNMLYTMKIEINGYYMDEGTSKVIAKNIDGTLYQNNFQTIKIEEREMVINDYYFVQQFQTQYDILKEEYGVAPKTSIENIFDEANISVDFPNTTHPPLYRDNPIPLPIEYGPILWDYAIANTSLGSNQTDSKHIVLIGMNDYYETEGTLGIGGASIIDPSLGSAAFVFTKRLELEANNYELNKKNVVKATAHELGHIRGKFLTPDEQAESNPYGDMAGLTNDAHTFGHFGNHYKYCIMAELENSEDKVIQATNPHFCEGHLQMLLNTSFKLGE